MKIFLHIGAGKCASSSIQQHFSYNNIQGKFAYGVIDDRNGNILINKELYARTLNNAADYSCSYGDIFLYPENLEKSLAECARKFDKLLLSCEAWHYWSNKFYQHKDIFKKYDVEIIFIVRPYVQWYNSAWWQWENWRKDIDDIDEHILQSTNIFVENTSGGGCSWHKNYLDYKKLPFVNKVHLLSLKNDVVEQLYKIMDLEYKDKDIQRHNISSSKELLSFFRLNKCYSHGFECSMNRYLKKRSSTPWVLSRENIEQILERTKATCLELAKHIENEDILNNPLWWDISAYEDKIAYYSRDITLSEETQEDLLDEANTIIINLEKTLNPKAITNDLLVQAYKKIESLDTEIRARNVREFIAEDKTLFELEEEKRAKRRQSINENAQKLTQGFIGLLVSKHLKFNYLRFRILSEITFGKKKEVYKRKKFELKKILETLFI